MRPREIDIDLANVDADGIADGNSSAGASVALDGVLTSGGTFTSADGLARQIVILDLGADDQSGATYTVTGTDANGKTVSEDITGPTASSSVESSTYFYTISSIAIASPVAGSTVDIGTVDEAASKIYNLDFYNPYPATVSVDVTGTINFTVQETFDSIYVSDPTLIRWENITALASKTADTTAQVSAQARGMRIIVNSYTDGAELQALVVTPRR